MDALISIGGDDTLKSANKLARFQHEHLPAGHHRIAVVHVPKTIDNDYEGIDFTFGYFTAVDTLSKEIQNLLADAEATRGYFIAETMGRSAGWLAYGAAIAGEASLVISVEDVRNEGWLTEEEAINPTSNEKFTSPGDGSGEGDPAHPEPDAVSREGGERLRRDRAGRGAG